jgi:aspartyl-tRNA(Asn)/glutamyl-tRNA(Gln) amidotransferase subunit C
MALTTEDVKRLAELARLELSDDELETRRGEIERILNYVDRLAKVDTAGVPETEGALLLQPLRADVSTETDQAVRELILSNFPDRLGDALRVPAVFEKPKG